MYAFDMKGEMKLARVSRELTGGDRRKKKKKGEYTSTRQTHTYGK